MASWAKPGVKCVCTNYDGWHEVGAAQDCDGPKGGDICEVASTGVDIHGPYIRLKGWDAPDDLYVVYAFRPLVTRTEEQDVAMFRDIAADTPFHLMIEEGLMAP